MNKRILNKALYYYSDALYHVTSEKLMKCAPDKSPKMLIVARHHYIEKVQSFPIITRKDLKAAINFEIADISDDFYVFHKIISNENGESRVILWQIPKSIIPTSVLVVLPETFLLQNSLAKNEILIFNALNGKSNTVIAKTNHAVHSISQLSDNTDSFAMSLGVQVAKIIHLSKSDIHRHIIEGLKKQVSSVFTNFWIFKKIDSEGIINESKKFVLPSLLTFFAYLVLSSIFVSVKHAHVSQTVDEQKTEIAQVLTLQTSIADLSEQYQNYQILNQQKQPVWHVWQVLHNLYERGVQFQFIRSTGEFVFFKARYKSASEVLEYLYDINTISGATYTTSVKKQGKVDSFIIKFKLTPSENTK